MPVLAQLLGLAVTSLGVIALARRSERPAVSIDRAPDAYLSSA